MTQLKYRMIVQYDGTRYWGWQYQPHGPTVQGTLEEKMRMILNYPVRLMGAGRTDAGVHADYQVAHFYLPRPVDTTRLRRSLNSVLPWDIRVRVIERVPPNFHARFSALWKEYVYRVYTGEVTPPYLHPYVWSLPVALNFGAMVEAAQDLVGTYNYAPFGKGLQPGQEAVRTVLWARWDNQHPLYVFHIACPGFLRGMVRYIVGLLVEIGMGRKPADAVRRILAEQLHDWVRLKAPPQGLCLAYIAYPPDRLYPENRR